MGSRSSRRRCMPVYSMSGGCQSGGFGGGYGGYPSVAYPPPMPSTYGKLNEIIYIIEMLE